MNIVGFILLVTQQPSAARSLILYMILICIQENFPLNPRTLSSTI